MADPADRAQDSIEHTLAAAIENARASGTPEEFRALPITGFCAWCGDPVYSGWRHCRPLDNDCEATHLRHVRYGRGTRV
jgi:hypothetical protein